MIIRYIAYSKVLDAYAALQDGETRYIHYVDNICPKLDRKRLYQVLPKEAKDLIPRSKRKNEYEWVMQEFENEDYVSETPIVFSK
jgi:hypothetical protein